MFWSLLKHKLATKNFIKNKLSTEKRTLTRTQELLQNEQDPQLIVKLFPTAAYLRFSLGCIAPVYNNEYSQLWPFEIK